MFLDNKDAGIIREMLPIMGKAIVESKPISFTIGNCDYWVLADNFMIRLIHGYKWTSLNAVVLIPHSHWYSIDLQNTTSHPITGLEYMHLGNALKKYLAESILLGKQE